MNQNYSFNNIFWSRSLFVFGFLILFSFGYSQKITLSSEITLRDDSAYAILGKIDNKLLLFRNKDYVQELSIFDQDLSLINSVFLEFEEKKINIIGFTTTEYDFNIYYSFRNEGNEYIKSVKISPRGEKLFQDTVKMEQSVFLSNYYRFQVSEDERYCVMYNDISDTKLKLILYDSQEMETVWERDISEENLDVRKEFESIEVSNQGDVHILFDKFNYNYRLEDHHLRKISIDKSNNISKNKIQLKNKTTVDVKMMVDNNVNELIIIGLHGKKLDNVSHGFFIVRENNLDVQDFQLNEFESAEVGGLKKISGLQDFKLTDVLLRNDGGILLAMELNKEYYRTSGRSRDITTGYNQGIIDYFTEDIFLMNLNPNNEVAWKQVLPKKQFSQDDEGRYSSYFIFKTPSKLHFIFNDEIKSNNTVSEYIVNPAGYFERNSIMNTAYQKLKLRIRTALQISANSFILTSEKNNKLNIVKVEY